MDIRLKTRAGGTVGPSGEALEALRSGLHGLISLPGEPGYDEARAIWNAMVDRRPGLVVRCAGTADVILCVNFAREHGVLLAVRGGGHNIAGNRVCDGGLMLIAHEVGLRRPGRPAGAR